MLCMAVGPPAMNPNCLGSLALLCLVLGALHCSVKVWHHRLCLAVEQAISSCYYYVRKQVLQHYLFMLSCPELLSLCHELQQQQHQVRRVKSLYQPCNSSACGKIVLKLTCSCCYRTVVVSSSRHTLCVQRACAVQCLCTPLACLPACTGPCSQQAQHVHECRVVS